MRLRELMENTSFATSDAINVHQTALGGADVLTRRSSCQIVQL
jgi:hypothetical protein